MFLLHMLFLGMKLMFEMLSVSKLQHATMDEYKMWTPHFSKQIDQTDCNDAKKVQFHVSNLTRNVS